MNPEELQSQIAELKGLMTALQTTIESQNSKINSLGMKLEQHNHNNHDGTKILTSELNISSGKPIKMGNGGLLADSEGVKGSTSETSNIYLVAGTDLEGAVGTTTNNLELVLQHHPNTTQSFIFALRPPLYTNVLGQTTSVTLGGSTVTIKGYNFVTNSLAGALIVIHDSSGAIVETQTIASNTATIITISGTWLNTTSGGTFIIYNPVFLGSADYVWQRVYTQEGTVGGLRFGVGATNGGQNGLLNMDATGDLFWRDKGGTNRLLATVASGTTLIAGRIPFAGTGGHLTDDADLTFAVDTLTATKIVGTTSIKVGTAAGFISSDGSPGVTGVITYLKTLTPTTGTITVKDGIITAFT